MERLSNRLTTGLWGVLGITLLSAAAMAITHRAAPRGVDAPPYAISLSTDVQHVPLPDGRWLDVYGAQGRAYLSDALHTERLALPESRRYGSATVMPSGQVLLWGGVDSAGHILGYGQWFDPRTKQFVRASNLGLPARAAHTLTVLTDGRVLMAGGWAGTKVPTQQALVWDVLQRQVAPVDGMADVPRFGAKAQVLSNGAVRIDGGTDPQGFPVKTSVLYDPQAQALLSVGHDSRAGDSVVAGVTTFPGADAADTPLRGPLALRFTEPVNLRELAGGKGVRLLGPNGIVDIRVIGAEGGRLAFVQLPDDLYPGARYTLFVQGLHTATGKELPYTASGFTTATFGAIGVSLAGQGSRPAAPVTEIPATSAAPPLMLTAGPEKSACAAKDIQSLCREHNLVLDGAWYPGQDNAPDASGGHWRLYHSRQTLPDTKIQEAHLAKNETALIGQVRRIDESPVANVEISIGEHKVRTDAQGVFVLDGLTEGRQEVFVDGRTATRGDIEYGRFLVGADIKAGTHNRMPFVMYLPRVLARDKIKVPSPTTREVVLTHPEMPGLELHIPAGTVFKDREGKVLTELAIVPTPVDHAPFPLPANFPMYFTIQPGDAVVQGLTAEAAKGIRLVYPNYGKQPAQTAADFWVYNVKSGWQMYGGGHVTADAKQLAPDPGVRLVWALGAGASVGNTVKPSDMTCGGKTVGEPIDLQTGDFFHEWVDLQVNDVIPLQVMRAQNGHAYTAFGSGAGFNYGMHLYSSNGFNSISLVMPCSQGITFNLVSGSATWPFTPATVWRHTATNSEFYGATLQFLFDTTSDGAHWVLTKKDGSQYWFNRHAPNSLAFIQDRFGNQVKLVYNGGLLEQVISPSGRTITFANGPNNFISSATDNAGRTVSYEYDDADIKAVDGSYLSVLTKVTYPDGTNEQYTYQSVPGAGVTNMLLPAMKTMRDRRGNIWVNNEWGSDPLNASTLGRITKQTLADGTSYQFSYTTDANGIVKAALVTDPNGNKEYVTFDPVSKYPLTDTRAFGTPLAQTTTYDRQASGLINSITDALGRVTAYSYDGLGNVAAITLLSGTSNAVTYRFTYTVDYNQIASVTDPLNHTTTFSYNNGCLAQITDPLGHSTTIACNSAGQPTAIEDALGHLTTLSYQGYDLVSVTDALSRAMNFTVDALGRRVSVKDPQGNVVLVRYDTNNRVAQVIDGLNQSTTVAYDGNGNPLSVTLPNNKVIAATYDNRNRRVTRTDALGQSETWTYDGMNHPLSYTDRKNQLTTYTYDALNRRSLVAYADGSGMQASYDAGNRLTSILDTASGSLSWSYDDLNRMTQAVTPQGTIAYGYDAASRRISMTPASQAVVSYQYDNANRLQSINQGSESVLFGYDDGNRRTNLTLPNGVTVSYGYDNGNQLTSLIYARGDGARIGDLSYSYDVAGRIVGQGGSLAPHQLPAATSQAGIFDDNNRQTGFNGGTLSYDANGDLTSDGINTFVWNARHQLTQVQQGGVTKLSYAYDALGRRVSKTVETATPTQYLYDGENTVQEMVGSVANPILAGLGTDERFARNDVSGRTYFLADMLGSTIGLADISGALRQRYSYDPYGNVTSTDTSSGFTNPYQYTGREADSAGLYYYRTRYYSPGMGRFISEDPIGFAGGQLNFYAYAGSNPVLFRDPNGTEFITALIGGIAGGIAGYEAGGWQGAVAGAVVGGVVGFFAPQLSAAAATWAGGGIAGMLAGTGATVGLGAGTGGVATVLGNELYNYTKPACEKAKHWSDGLAFGVALGAAAPLMSGEAFAAGAGDAIVGEGASNVFSGLTGAFNVFGEAMDPEAAHGFRPSEGGDGCGCGQ